MHAKLNLFNENSPFIVNLIALILCIKTSIDVPVFVVAPEIMVQQKRIHNIPTPRNREMEFQQLPYYIIILNSSNIYQVISPMISLWRNYVWMKITTTILHVTEGLRQHHAA